MVENARARRPTRLFATILGAIGVTLWATETTFITYTTGIPPLQTVALALMFAALLSPIAWLVTGAHPLAAFHQPWPVWVVTVGAMFGYHACIYYATQQAPPAAAALLQGTTPLIIVFGSALLPGERLRWWHAAGALLGLAGVLFLIEYGGETSANNSGATFYLSLIGIAAALWGVYSLVARRFPDVPSSAMGTFYGAAALLAAGLHISLETWVTPTTQEWLAMAGLGILPMGLAIYFWDFGVKKGDIQALGAFSYVEPFIGAVLVALFAGAALDWNLLWSGCLVVSGAVLASRNIWQPQTPIVRSFQPKPIEVELLQAGLWLSGELGQLFREGLKSEGQMHELKQKLSDIQLVVDLWDECHTPNDASGYEPHAQAA